jgi:hypothetical protein
MSYDTQKLAFGKQAVQFIELHLEGCSRTYGVAPCAAAIGITGDKKCFNTFATCQDKANFASQPVIYRFSTSRLDELQGSGEHPTLPTLLSVDTAPTVLTPGKGLGIRSSVKARLQDHPWTDVSDDLYRATRGYDPDAQGTFWGKFLARHKYYLNRKMVVHTGFLTDAGGYDPTNFVTRTYVITKITGPNNGQVDIEAKDPLRLADNEKVKFPAPCTSTLVSAITTSDTSISITDTSGAVAAQLSVGTLAQPYLRLEKEIVRVTAWSVASLIVTATVVRGSVPTFYDATFNIIAAHGTASQVQTTWLFESAYAHDVVYHLLGTAVGLPTAYLPLSEWSAEILNGFQYMRFSRLIVEPIGAKDLLTEITEHGVLIWWDERRGVVRLKGLRFYGLLADTINDSSSIAKDSSSATEDTAALATEVWINYAHTAPLEDPKQLKSYRLLDVRADLDAEGTNAYASTQILAIHSKWLPPSASSNVASMAQLLLRQYSTVRKVVSWAMDPKDDIYWVGDVVGLSTRSVQDDQGLNATRNYLILSVDEVWSADGVMLKYVGAEQFNFLRTGGITHPNGAGGDPTPAPADYSLATPAEQNAWIYIGPNTGTTFSDGKPLYQIT